MLNMCIYLYKGCNIQMYFINVHDMSNILANKSIKGEDSRC